MELRLPTPHQEALAYSEQLRQHIASIISQKGVISFAEYMELALYTPALGYYRNALPKFGTDFITAPELSPHFAHCLGVQCQEIFTNLPQANILELGPGSGQLAVDLLLYLEQQQALPERYFLLELSASLQKRQQEKLQTHCPHLYSRVQWLNELPSNLTGVILANEVLDAMPTHRFEIEDNQLYEQFVGSQQGKFHTLRTETTHAELIELFQSQTWPATYCSEINLHLKPWIRSLSKCLNQGVILIVDYGYPEREYYHPDRSMGTLMCHYQHYAHHDPFFCPGLQDITAHVDFTAIAEATPTANLDVLGYTNQASFLLSCGLLEHTTQMPSSSEKQRYTQQRAIQTLTSPAEMGELFKVIALGRNFERDLVGFELSDKQASL